MDSGEQGCLHGASIMGVVGTCGRPLSLELLYLWMTTLHRECVCSDGKLREAGFMDLGGAGWLHGASLWMTASQSHYRIRRPFQRGD